LLKQQDEWEDYFGGHRDECRDLVGRIEEVDRAIDRMVYELYGLSEEEINIVEK